MLKNALLVYLGSENNNANMFGPSFREDMTHHPIDFNRGILNMSNIQLVAWLLPFKKFTESLILLFLN